MLKKIILLISAVLILSGCADDQYTIEKKHWRVQKQANKIFKNPHASPPKELENTVKLLNNFAQKYPANNLAVDAEFNIARLYIVKEEYDNARAQLKSLLDKYNKSDFICAEALFLLGNSYEMENKWDSALTQYKQMIQKYPLTLKGIDMPLYIAQHYKVKYQPERMISAYQEAIAHYNALAAKYPGSPLAYNCQNLVAQSYLALKDWQNAIAALNNLIERYKGKVKTDGILMEIALIYQKELKDTPKAKEALETLLKEYPKSKLVKAAKSLLKEWSKK